MKLIAGSIIASFGLLVIALGHLFESFASEGRHLHPGFAEGLGAPIAFLAVLFMVGGIVLIGWAIWEIVTKKE